MGDSAKKKTIRFDSVPQTSQFDSIHCKQETSTKSQTSCWTVMKSTTPGSLINQKWINP